MLDPIRNPFTPSAEMIAELRERLPDQVPDEFESWPPKRQWDLYHNLIDKLRGFTEPTSVPKQKFVLRSGSNPEHSGSPAPVVAPPKAVLVDDDEWLHLHQGGHVRVKFIDGEELQGTLHKAHKFTFVLAPAPNESILIHKLAVKYVTQLPKKRRPNKSEFALPAEMISELREKFPNQVPDELESWPARRQCNLYRHLMGLS